MKEGDIVKIEYYGNVLAGLEGSLHKMFHEFGYKLKEEIRKDKINTLIFWWPTK